MNDSYENVWVENYFDLIKEIFNDSKYEKFLESTFNIYKWNNDPPFIFCLSASKDILSQWRAYSNDGKGVSIGFKTNQLKFHNRIPAPNVYAHNTLGIAKIEYLTYTQKQKVKSLCLELKNRYDKMENEDEKILAPMDLSFNLINWGISFKNSSFKEEKEWRLIHTPTDTYEEPLSNLSELLFRSNGEKIITYFQYDFEDSFDSKLIPEIVLGPKCNMTEKEVRKFLDYNNLVNTKVTLSKSTYR